MKQRLTLILIGALISYAYYLLSSPSILEETFLKGEISNAATVDIASREIVNNNLNYDHNDSKKNIGSNLYDETKNKDVPGDTKRHFEIFGRVVDEYDQPIDNTLVAEDRYFYNTRTDSDGRYKIIVEMPGQEFPVLRFLRSGFRGKRIQLDDQEWKKNSMLELDVVLAEDIDAISIDGWVGNEIGVGLGELKIQLTSRDSQGLDIIFLTVFSDEKGYFTLEGIGSGELYKLTVFSTPEYLYYVDEEFVVTQNSAPLKIILESLNFVDIDGMIVNSDAEPITNFEIYIRNITTGTHVRKLVTDSSGFFSLRKFPAGEVSLSTQGPEYFKIEGLTLQANEYRSLRLLVDRGDHNLSGWVSDENGIALPKILVKLDANLEDGAVESSSYRVKGTDSGGNFYFDNLGSGEHLISIYAYGFKRQEITHRFESQNDKIHIILSRK